MSSFTTPLELEYLDGRNWRVTQEFDYLVGSEAAPTDVIRVHAGFITDFASVPRVLWILLPPTGRYGKAALIHDLLYREGWPKPPKNRFTRAQCDSILREASGVLGCSLATRWVLWAGVRLGGWFAYQRKNPNP